MLFRRLTEELQKCAQIELNETPENREEVLDHIVKWINKEPNINFPTDGLFLLNFLRASKFSTQKAKQKIEVYLKAKAVLPEVFINRDPTSPSVQQLFAKGPVIGFSTPDKDCTLLRWRVISVDDDYVDLAKIISMIFEIILNESETNVIVGNYIIADMKNFPMKFLMKIELSVLKRFIQTSLSAFPNRLKMISFINCADSIEIIFNILKPFFTAKILERVSFYGENFNELFEKIPQQYFPKEYGGSEHSIDDMTKFWMNKVESYRDWFKESEKYSFGTTKSPLAMDKTSITYGIEGSFRQFEID